ncbi:RICIN domain-containing protein [Streptomyces sp. NBC_00536]|uniref:RICIN domain-containing protein n=1 Tax=Streptomyces sp. NBC_00536 TaxID=2975769 RepID=UPI002E812A4B|nr:RICIN domain-containing protein [Streptomyces sp. NBC_00536]WUC83183.1 RICIN domain-containing protein [Streptomyces sp. NBC_00536]
MRTTAAAAVLALGLAGVMATPAAGALAPYPPTAPTKMKSQNSQKCADVEARSLANGAAVHQWSCVLDNDNNQKWTFEASSAHIGYFRLINLNSKKCMDVEGPSYADGAKIHQWECYGTDSQEWKVEYLGDEANTFKLVNRHSGKCMDVEGWSKDNGAKIHQWTCHGGDDSNQRWNFA